MSHACQRHRARRDDSYLLRASGRKLSETELACMSAPPRTSETHLLRASGREALWSASRTAKQLVECLRYRSNGHRGAKLTSKQTNKIEKGKSGPFGWDKQNERKLIELVIRVERRECGPVDGSGRVVAVTWRIVNAGRNARQDSQSVSVRRS